MAVNSYKDDEKLTEKSKAVTLRGLFSYLLAYKWQILLVLVLMFYGVAISLLNPIMIESAIDRYIGKNNLSGAVPPDGDRAHLKPVCGTCDEDPYVYHGKGL